MGRPSRPWYWKQRGGWYTTLNGKRHLLARGEKAATRREAEREFHRLMLVEGHTVETDRAKLTCQDVFDLYLLHAEGQAQRGEKAAETYAAYEKHLVSATRVLGSIRVADVRPRDFLRWVDRPSWGPTMRNTALTVAKIAFRWARKVGHLVEDPIAGMELPRPRKREAIPTHDQVEAMLKAAWGQPFRDLLTALIQTGCRPGEITRLTADRVDLQAGLWWVRDKVRWKTGQEFRKVHLNATMIALTRRLVEQHPEGLVFRNSRGGAWSKGVVSYRFIRLRHKLGFGPECTAYALRHLYVTDALERGVPPATVAELVGHRTLDQIMATYSKLGLRTEHLRDAVATVRPAAGT